MTPTDVEKSSVRERTITATATDTEWNELAQAAALQGQSRGPWVLATALAVAERLLNEAAARRAAEMAADDGA